MRQPNPRFSVDSPIQTIESKVLFPVDDALTHMAASLIRLPGTGRLLLAWRRSYITEQENEGHIALSHSDDDGETWSEPRVLHENEGWRVMPLGGINVISDDLVHLIVGGIQLDLSLGGPEPFTAMYAAPMDSRDGGKTWSEPGPDIDLFPEWTEVYGASNPHMLSDGRLMWAVIGTMGRDDQWHCGVTFTDAEGNGYTKPTIIAYAPDRNFADTDVVRLDDGRYLAVIREMNDKDSWYSHSSDEGKTWSPIQRTGFKGANTKLFRLRSGAIICAYRNEESDLTRRGVAVSLSTDGGSTWEEIGWLYSAPPESKHSPGYVCGYPDMAYISNDEILCTLHTYPDENGRIDLHQVRLCDKS